MTNLDKEKRVTFNSVAWILMLVAIFQLNPLVGLGFICSFWVVFY